MRVISMVPSWTETLLRCGVDVVGRTRFCIHPRELVKAIPVVGGTKDIDWNRIRACGADLLLLDCEENPKTFADQSPLPFHATHVRRDLDVPNELRGLAGLLSCPGLAALAERWDAILKFHGPNFKGGDFPGLQEWVRKPEVPIERVLYLIWKDPWMAVSRQTFIGSMLERVGFLNLIPDFPDAYPKLCLEDFSPDSTLLLCSSEPYRFNKMRPVLRDLNRPVALVDGEVFSWFGVRSLDFLDNYFSKAVGVGRANLP